VRACADPISLSAAQAVPVGLIVNEAVTNALKHAFPGERPGSVTVRLRRQGERGLRLEIADDGVGLPVADAGAAGSGGTRLIGVLARQLSGHAAWQARPGTAVVVTFPEAPPD
jgi:two-component sensor histidine kinase